MQEGQDLTGGSDAEGNFVKQDWQRYLIRAIYSACFTSEEDKELVWRHSNDLPRIIEVVNGDCHAPRLDLIFSGCCTPSDTSEGCRVLSYGPSERILYVPQHYKLPGSAVALYLVEICTASSRREAAKECRPLDQVLIDIR